MISVPGVGRHPAGQKGITVNTKEILMSLYEKLADTSLSKDEWNEILRRIRELKIDMK